MPYYKSGEDFKGYVFVAKAPSSMDQCALKNTNNCLNTNVYSYLETPGGPSSNLYLNVVHFFNASVY
jgi:hypothetical protein